MKIMKVLFVLVLASLIVAACAPVTAQLVGLPEEGRLLVLSLVTAGLTAALLWLGGLMKLDLGGFVQPIAAAVSPLIIAVIEYFLGMIPSVYDDFVLVVIHYIVLFLG